MWGSRILDLLAQPPEFLRLLPESAARGEAFTGRYLSIDGEPYALGRFIAQGDEAMVYELVDLRLGGCVGVVKICRFAPGHDRYDQWAQPIRAEVNPHSKLADVELHPARLVDVAGGVVKVQPYLARDPATAWATPRPAEPVHRAIGENRRADALAAADALLAQHGHHAVLLEARGLALLMLERTDEAAEVLEAAVGAHVREGNAGRLSSSCLLARALWQLYLDAPPEGAGLTLELPGGFTHTQIAFPDAESAALDDTRQDRGLLVLLEALAAEPYCVRALGLAGDMIRDEPGGIAAARTLRRAIDLIDPGFPAAASLRAWLDALPPDDAKPETARMELPTPSAEGEAEMHRFDQHYAPEPERAQHAAGRAASARYWASRGDLHAAARELRAALELAPGEPAYAVELVTVLLEDQRPDEATVVAQRARGRFPDDAQVLAVVADVAIARGELAEAKRALIEARWLEPDDLVRVEVKLAYVLRDAGEIEEALSVVRRAIDRTDDERAISTLAELLAYPRGLDESPAPDGVVAGLDVLSQGLQRQPRSARLYAARALYLVHAGRPEEAIGDLVTAVDLDPTHPYAASMLRDLRQAFGPASPPRPVGRRRRPWRRGR
jgi:tetratricopeptide (TPR) repeat protein